MNFTMIKHWKQGYLISFIIFVLLFFSPRISGIDYSLIFSLILALLFWFRRYSSKLVIAELISLSFFEKMLLYLLFYSFVLFEIAGFANYQQNGHYFFRVFRSICFIFSLRFLYYDLKLSFKIILWGAASAVILQILLVWAQYFSTYNLKLFFLNLNTLTPVSQTVLADSSSRVRGLMKGFDGASLIIGTLVIPLLFLTTNKIYKIIGTLGLLITLVIVARIGMALVLFSVISYAFYTVFNLKKDWKIWGASLFGFLFFVYLVVKDMKRDLTNPIFRTFELPFYMLHSRMFYTSSTSDTMINHLTVSNLIDPRIWIFGKASAQLEIHGPNILSSDVGFIHFLYNFGIFNLFIFIFFLIFQISQIPIKKNRFILGSFCFFFLLSCLKGPYFFSRGYFDLFLLAIFCGTQGFSKHVNN